MTQNRRDFIKTAALAAIGSGIAANKLFAETPVSLFSILRNHTQGPYLQLLTQSANRMKGEVSYG